MAKFRVYFLSGELGWFLKARGYILIEGLVPDPGLEISKAIRYTGIAHS